MSCPFRTSVIMAIHNFLSFQALSNPLLISLTFLLCYLHKPVSFVTQCSVLLLPCLVSSIFSKPAFFFKRQFLSDSQYKCSFLFHFLSKKIPCWHSSSLLFATNFYRKLCIKCSFMKKAIPQIFLL